MGIVPREVVLRQLKVLLNKVEQGEQWEIMNLYHLFHDSLDILVNEEREIVNLYVMNIFIHHSENAEKMKVYEQKKMLVSIGKQIETEKEKAVFFDLIEKVVINWKKDRIVYFQIVDQLLNSLTTERKEKTLSFIKEKISHWKKDDFDEEYNEGNYLPF